MKRIMEPIRWQDLGNIFLGAWLFVSPWVLDYFIGMPAAAKNSFSLGLTIVIFAAVAVYIPQIWEEWINMALAYGPLFRLGYWDLMWSATLLQMMSSSA